MIKIVAIGLVGEQPELDLSFSDGSQGRWSAAYLIARDSSLTRALAEPSYFGRCFIEGGALAWPNGLEFSPDALHIAMENAGQLRKKAA